MTPDEIKDLRETLVCACADRDPTKGVEDRSLFCYRAVEIVAALDTLEIARAEIERLGRECTRLGDIVKGACEQTKEAFAEAERKDKQHSIDVSEIRSLRVWLDDERRKRSDAQAECAGWAATTQQVRVVLRSVLDVRSADGDILEEKYSDLLARAEAVITGKG
jgi:hypothetical protein